MKDIEEVRKILKGKISVVRRSYKESMQVASSNLKFELAQSYKEKIDLLEKFQSKSLVVNQNITNTDVFTITPVANKSLFINYMRIENGAIINSETIQVKKKIEEDDEDIFRFLIFDLRKKYNSETPVILTNKQVEGWENVKVMTPKIGDKRKLVELSLRNALCFEKEKYSKNPTQPNEQILLKLQEELKLSELPIHIECFDNSNIHGTNPVASMVCFKNGKPSKSNYRKYNIKTVIGSNDFASINEVVGRRYSYLKKENLNFPNLIIIDGGKGQLNAACNALRNLHIYGQISIIGIAKKLEEIYFPEDNIPIYLNKKSSSLKIIQQLRNEAHRFAINFHRNKRRKSSITSALSSIKGIGSITYNKLMNKFGSIKRLKQSSKEDVINFIGQSKADILFDAIKKRNL